MRRMKRNVVGVSLSAAAVILSTLVACGGPSSEGQDVKTPDELLADQEAQAAEDEKRRAAAGDDYDNNVDQTEDEKMRQWDETGADRALKQAARSAETCPDSVPEKAPKGMGTVNLVFKNDGNVKSSEIAPPYSDTPVGECVLRAMGSVIVPSYEGAEKQVTWEVDLNGKKAEPAAAKKK
jgi:hypothetical protein